MDHLLCTFKKKKIDLSEAVEWWIVSCEGVCAESHNSTVAIDFG